MGAGFGDHAVVEDDDLVGMGDGVQPVGDDQDGPVLGQPIERLLHKVFRFRVGESGGLVEDQHRGVGKDGAGDGQALPLPTGQSRTRAEHRVVALRHALDTVVDAGSAGGRDDPVDIGVRIGERNIVGDATVHQLCVLQHETHPPVQLVGRQRADIVTADADGAVLGVVEPGQQRGQR